MTTAWASTVRVWEEQAGKNEGRKEGRKKGHAWDPIDRINQRPTDRPQHHRISNNTKPRPPPTWIDHTRTHTHTGTLHRISVIYDREREQALGATLRCGRHITGNVEAIRDLLQEDPQAMPSILVLGPPGTGKARGWGWLALSFGVWLLVWWRCVVVWLICVFV
jgi:hypothetical protein